MAKCFLVLEDGTIMEGTGFGSMKTASGEVVFSTGMTGYQEGLTDPSFRGQILTMSYPLIGNYGINSQDMESDKVQVRGFVVRELCDSPSPGYGGKDLNSFLEENDIPGIAGVDTRSLIIRIRTAGTMKGAIVYDEDPVERLEELRRMPYPSDSNLVGEVSTPDILHFPKEGAKKVALFDCGVKNNIVRELRKRFDLYQLPYDTPVKFFRDHEIDGLFLSNGPGDPAHPVVQDTIIRNLRTLKDDYPIMGICLGNQLLCQVFGGTTYKLKFGHRGANQPVKYRDRVFITSQNHGYAVDPESLQDSGLVVDQTNVNDGTVEGMRHKELPIFSVQYHPEASPGPRDTGFLFDDFVKMLEACR
ncbi:MAG TPA: glutamine-hydrolyzing carbamoyl-phosphate synthase small subunit [Methanomassiliicoccales archaeon]|nr:glutamine-hydrolyzing carbamoyl-phosphate synthase small subunit [Methanomassiliicoccales archaeon]